MRLVPLLGDRYRLGPEIGAGGMGAVHKAWDERFDREVAIKLVKAGADPVEHERLRREAQYLAGLDHPNLVAVLDAGDDTLGRRDTVWFAMELVDGPDLRTVLRQDGPMGGAGVRRVVAGVLAALGVLHAADVVHRDLKPANVLLTGEPADGPWDVKVVDLGIAYQTREDHLTSTGQVLGTAAYLSPEQVSGRTIGPASDVYALGLVAIEALTGRVAFPGGMMETATARLVRAPQLPRNLDPAWRAVLTAMTALHAEDRPATSLLLDRVRALPDDAILSTAEITAVLPVTAAVAVEGQDTAVLTAQLPGWSPSLRSRPASGRRRSRTLLGAAAIALAIGLAGGGAAVIGASSASDAVHAQPAHSAASHRSSARPTPAKTTKATAKATPAAATTPPPVQQTAASTARSAIRRLAHGGLRRLRDRIQHDLGRGLPGLP